MTDMRRKHMIAFAKRPPTKEEAIKRMEAEVNRLSKGLNKCKSRWLNGYIDGLIDAIKILKGEKQ